MKLIKRTGYKVFQLIILTLFLNMCFVFSAFANAIDFTGTNLYTGTRALLRGGTLALTAIVVVLTIFLSIKDGIAWQMADDHEKPQKKKALINTIAIGVLIASLSGLITLILGAYGLTDGAESGTAAIGTYHFAENVSHHLVNREGSLWIIY